MPHRRFVPIVAAAGIALSGCATIMAGGPDKVPVSSNPPGASVYVDNAYVGVTPTVVILDRERSQGTIRIEAEGYAPIVLTRSKRINGWFWANLCVGGLIGIVVDLVTGDIKRFDDSAINVSLAPDRRDHRPPPPHPRPPGVDIEITPTHPTSARLD